MNAQIFSQKYCTGIIGNRKISSINNTWGIFIVEESKISEGLNILYTLI